MDPLRQRVLELVSRHGWNATAFQTLEAGYSYYLEGDACVAYVDTGAAWVVAGAPLAAPEEIGPVALRFVAQARAAGRRCCFFGTEERFRAAAAALRSLSVGEQPVYDPRQWPEVLASSNSLRAQLRRAGAKGVRVRVLTADEIASDPVKAALEGMARRWLATRNMAPMSFLVKLELFGLAQYRRCFVAEIGERAVGFAGLVPVPARPGWLLEDLIRDPEAPNGTSELLVDAAMTWAASDGCDWLTLGLSPLSGAVPWPLRLIRRATRSLYDFEGVRWYKAKLKPRCWSTIFLSYPATQSASRSVLDVLAAFTGSGFVSFGLRSLLRGPQALVRVLAALLVPWTVLLMLAPAERWFGAAPIKWAWVAFDVGLLVGFWHLLRRPSTRLYTALALTVTADAILTLLQAMVWNLPRLRGPADALLVFVACAAPALVGSMLWGARRRSAALG